ncbi:MAG: toprim domain-containing protein, partial [Tidjanibacter sp.]|nr:toprim domain-containing protein [Tidjanibacter sp.]
LLLENIQRQGIKEVILAIGTTVEGETTLFYISRRLEQFPDVKVTTIARGIGFGDEIEYADELTIAHAISNRTVISR